MSNSNESDSVASASLQRPSVGVGVLVHHGNGKKILLIQRKAAHGLGTWSTTGGHLEFGENPEDCAIRETREEANVQIGNIRFLGITNDVFVDSDKHYVTI